MVFYDYTQIPDNKTTRAFCRAIVSLVEKHSPEDITVNMILEESENARSTFYRYFQDKYALMYYVYYRDLQMEKDFSPYDMTEEDYVPNLIRSYDKQALHSRYYAKLSKEEGPDSFREFLNEFWYRITKDYLARYYSEEKYDSMMDYTARIFSIGMCDITVKWFLSECSSATSEEMAQLCNKYLPPEMRKTLQDKQ